jgi:hypothetical protein
VRRRAADVRAREALEQVVIDRIDRASDISACAAILILVRADAMELG